MHKLLESGKDIAILVRNPGHQLFPAPIKVVQGDLGNPAALAELCRGADIVVHIAGAISAVDRAAYFDANVTGTKNLVQAASEAAVKRIVYISSLAARHLELSDYAASKAGGESALQAFPGERLVLRPSAVYGQGDMATLPLLQQLMRNIAIIPGTSSQKFAMIHVADLAVIVSNAVSSNMTGICELDDTQGAHTWHEIMGIVRSAFQQPRHTIFLPRPLAMAVAIMAQKIAKVRATPGMISVGKMRELYHADWTTQGEGWPRPNPVHLREGLLQTINWYIENGHIRRIT